MEQGTEQEKTYDYNFDEKKKPKCITFLDSSWSNTVTSYMLSARS